MKLADIANYLDIFDKFISSNESKDSSLFSNHMLSQYFKLPNIYLSFIDDSDMGASDDNVYFMKTNTGKVKITTQEYLKYLNFFGVNHAVMPYEFVNFAINLL